MELPDDTALRAAEIEALARDQTEGLETQYEKALALEAWLRSFKYTTDITPAAAADELGAWLLDETSNNYREGYCENFATALAVMARTLGIHSRAWSIHSGEQTSQEGAGPWFRDRNAHAWVELWMPSQGWVKFDPTPRPDRINPSTIGAARAAVGRRCALLSRHRGADGGLGWAPRPFELLFEGELPEIIVVDPRPGQTGGGSALRLGFQHGPCPRSPFSLSFGGIPLVKLRASQSAHEPPAEWRHLSCVGRHRAPPPRTR